MADRQQLILKRLDEEGQKTAAFFRGLAPEQLEQQVYTTGPLWRVRDILAHFVSAEQTFAFYGRQILAGGPGAPDDFVIDEYNAAQVAARAAETPEALVRQFEAARAETAALVTGMSEADFERLGRHPWFGRAPLGQMLKLIYRHTMLHERDVRRALETGAPVAHVDAVPPAA
jgi:uncharacterized protein (TIGR03083 family)